jgi:predicted 2-oxoglutarate/Fe(II)-dependent dioxygenase YbiX
MASTSSSHGFRTPPQSPRGSGAAAAGAGPKTGAIAAVLAKRQHLHCPACGKSPPALLVACVDLPANAVASLATQQERAPYALTIECALSEAECAELIEATEAIGYGEALVNVGGGRQLRMAEVRNSDRCIVDDAAAAEMIWQRIKRFVPQEFGEGQRRGRALGLNERLRFLKYGDGQYFAPHADGAYRRPYCGVRGGEYSMVTVQLYLTAAAAAPPPSSSPEGVAAVEAARFRGGATRFLSSVYGDGDDGVDVVPAAGRVLCFQHELLHEGSLVRSPERPLDGDRGAFKYAIRTDVMYTAAEGPIEQWDYEHQPL